jgi:hypothetical protein
MRWIASTYRTIVATGFLCLYVFIYMPVQLWHHHIDAKEKISKAKSAKTSVGSSTDDCKICQHTYTAYINDNSRFEINISELLHGNPVTLVAAFSCPFIDRGSNKGPPNT